MAKARKRKKRAVHVVSAAALGKVVRVLRMAKGCLLTAAVIAYRTGRLPDQRLSESTVFRAVRLLRKQGVRIKSARGAGYWLEVA